MTAMTAMTATIPTLASALGLIAVLGRRRTVRSFLARQLRWCQMRRRIAPWAYLLEPLLAPTPWALAFPADRAEYGVAPERVTFGG